MYSEIAENNNLALVAEHTCALGTWPASGGCGPELVLERERVRLYTKEMGEVTKQNRCNKN
jgi:hypothetical protein